MPRPLINQTELGRFLRFARVNGRHGPIDRFCNELGVGRTTLAAYERGKKLPEIDFLALFSKKTGADFNTLLHLRLLAGTGDAQEVAMTKQPAEINEERSGYVDRTGFHSTINEQPTEMNMDVFMAVVKAVKTVVGSRSVEHQVRLSMTALSVFSILARDPEKLSTVTEEDAETVVRLAAKFN